MLRRPRALITIMMLALFALATVIVAPAAASPALASRDTLHGAFYGLQSHTSGTMVVSLRLSGDDVEGVVNLSEFDGASQRFCGAGPFIANRDTTPFIVTFTSQDTDAGCGYDAGARFRGAATLDSEGGRLWGELSVGNDGRSRVTPDRLRFEAWTPDTQPALQRYRGDFHNTTRGLDGVLTMTLREGSQLVVGTIDFDERPGEPTLCGAGEFAGLAGDTLTLIAAGSDTDDGCGRESVTEISLALAPDRTSIAGTFSAGGETGTFTVQRTALEAEPETTPVVSTDQPTMGALPSAWIESFTMRPYDAVVTSATIVLGLLFLVVIPIILVRYVTRKRRRRATGIAYYYRTAERQEAAQQAARQLVDSQPAPRQLMDSQVVESQVVESHAIGSPPLLGYAAESPPPSVPVVESSLPSVPAIESEPVLSPAAETEPVASLAAETEPVASPAAETEPAFVPIMESQPAPVAIPVIETEPALSPAVETEPALSRAVETEPALVPIVESQPAPVASHAVETEPALSHAVETEPALSPVIETEPALSHTVETEPAQTEPVRPEISQPVVHQVTNHQTTPSKPAVSEPPVSRPVISQPAASQPTVSQPVPDHLRPSPNLPPAPPSFTRIPTLLTLSEHTFFQALRLAAPPELAVYPQVRLASLIMPTEQSLKQRQDDLYRIQTTCVDFVLCDDLTTEPKLVVELDRSPHHRPDRRERDALVYVALELAGLPLLRIQWRTSYVVDEIAASIRQKLGLPPASQLELLAARPAPMLSELPAARPALAPPSAVSLESHASSAVQPDAQPAPAAEPSQTALPPKPRTGSITQPILPRVRLGLIAKPGAQAQEEPAAQQRQEPAAQPRPAPPQAIARPTPAAPQQSARPSGQPAARPAAAAQPAQPASAVQTHTELSFAAAAQLALKPREMSWACGQCHRPIAKDADICPHCGAVLVG